MLTVTADAQWQALAPLLGLDPAWDRETRQARAHGIDAALQAWLASRVAMEAATLLQTLGVPAAPLHDLAQLAGSAHLAARAMVREVAHPAYGPVPLIDTPLATGAPRSGPWRLQPELGEHNEEVIGGLLGRHDELDGLRADGVIG
jgi:crotonobetainyl-CoA:carnitine CoA-transferase CaiB-like acyl-CoA transferase